jgi:hypothetical protein
MKKLTDYLFYLGVLLMCVQINAIAATYRVDDAATLTNDAQVKMRWRSMGANNANGNIVDGASLVTIRLNTSPWQNKIGQIYMVLPPQPIGQVLVDWTTQGKLLSGSLLSGNRTLVYAGLIQTPMIEDTIYVQVHGDGTRILNLHKLEFHFEIDVE